MFGRFLFSRPIFQRNINNNKNRSEGMPKWDISSLVLMGWRAGGDRKFFRRRRRRCRGQLHGMIPERGPEMI